VREPDQLDVAGNQSLAFRSRRRAENQDFHARNVLRFDQMVKKPRGLPDAAPGTRD
jgi:hypothetical protein